MTQTPNEGPRLLFFSGGTALGETAHALSGLTRHAVHVVTPFDSGGSSAVLREAFDMPAVGDMRSRLLALADCSHPGVDPLVRLLARRLPANELETVLERTLRDLAQGRHASLADLDEPGRDFVCGRLRVLLEHGNVRLTLAGASLGNLVLAGGFLASGRSFDTILHLFSERIRALGVVRPSSSGCAHLAVRLRDGSVIAGQDRFTGKKGTPIGSPIAALWLTAARDSADPVRVPADPEVLRLVRQADLICYPVGSFYSSVLANLLPEGMVEAVASSPCPKVFIPNVTPDPELAGQSVADQVEALRTVAEQAGSRLESVLTTVLADTRTVYPGGVPDAHLAALGVRVARLPFVRTGALSVDPVLLSRILVQEAICWRTTA